MQTPAVTAVLSLCYTAAVLGETALVENSATEKYQAEDAYQIYSLLVPQEESYRFAKGTLAIQMETVVQPEAGLPRGPEACLVPRAVSRFKEAIADYERLNRETWLLQKLFPRWHSLTQPKVDPERHRFSGVCSSPESCGWYTQSAIWLALSSW